MVAPEVGFVEDGTGGGLDFAPTLEGVTYGGVGVDFGRREEVAAEEAVGDGLVVEGERGGSKVGAQASSSYLGGRELVVRVGLEVVEQLGLTLGRETGDERTCRTPGRVVVVERLGGGHELGNLADDGFATFGFEDRGGDEAEGVDELLEEVVVLEQVEEEDDGLELPHDGGGLGAVAVEVGEFGHPFHLEDVEGIVDPVHGFEVEEDHAEATVGGAGTPALAVVFGPVAVAQIELDGHVVAVLVDVEELADLGVGFGRGGVGRQVEQALHGFVGAALLHIARVGGTFELVDLVVVEAVVGIDEVLVAGFAEVDGALVDAIDDVPDGLIGLVVDVDVRTRDNLLEGHVEDAADGVAATIAHQH